VADADAGKAARAEKAARHTIDKCRVLWDGESPTLGSYFQQFFILQPASGCSKQAWEALLVRQWISQSPRLISHANQWSMVGVLKVRLKNPTVLNMRPEKIISEFVQSFDQFDSEYKVGYAALRSQTTNIVQSLDAK
jgi:hypothetical protein